MDCVSQIHAGARTIETVYFAVAVGLYKDQDVKFTLEDLLRHHAPPHSPRDPLAHPARRPSQPQPERSEERHAQATTITPGAIHRGVRILTQCLVEVERTHLCWDRDANAEGDCIRAWILFLLLPRMLLHPMLHGGQARDRDLSRRSVLFDAGEWGQLLERARRTTTRRKTPNSTRTIPDKEITDSKIQAAIALV